MADLKKGASMGLTLGKGSKNNAAGAKITLNLEDYLVPGPRLGQTENTCFLPIFTADPGQDLDAFETWFLGNMFMD